MRIYRQNTRTSDEPLLLLLVKGVLLAHSIGGNEVSPFCAVGSQEWLEPVQPVVLDVEGSLLIFWVVVDPVSGEEDHFTLLLFGEVSQLVLARGEVFRVEVHAYSNSTPELIFIHIADFDILEAFPLLAPELVSVVKVGFLSIEDEVSLPVAEGS